MKHSPNITRFGLWLRAGIIGAGIFLIGVAQLVTGEAHAGLTAGMLLLGALMVAGAWRARNLLESASGQPAASQTVRTKKSSRSSLQQQAEGAQSGAAA